MQSSDNLLCGDSLIVITHAIVCENCITLPVSLFWNKKKLKNSNSWQQRALKYAYKNAHEKSKECKMLGMIF